MIDVTAQEEDADESASQGTTSQDAANEDKKDETKATQEVKVTETKVEDDISTDFIFDSTPVELKESTNTAKPTFNNVKGGSASTEKTAPKATTQKQNKPQATI